MSQILLASPLLTHIKSLAMVGSLCGKATSDEVPGTLGGSRWQLRACVYGAGLREPTAPSGGSKRAQPGFLRRFDRLCFLGNRGAGAPRVGSTRISFKVEGVGQGADNMVCDHWLYPHAHPEQGEIQLLAV